MASNQNQNRNRLIWIVAGAGALVVFGLLGYALYKDQTAPVKENVTQRPEIPSQCTHSPIEVTIEGMEKVPCLEQTHVPANTKVSYQTDPPASGPHYEVPLTPGLYRRAQQAERLVHNLEHGNVVIYYNDDKLSKEGKSAIESLTSKYKGTFDGVVAVPRKDEKYALILTAWEHVLKMEQYDKARFDQFVTAFRGHGPENPAQPTK